jgi:hypothetical protein
MGCRINWSTRKDGVGAKEKKVAEAGAAAVGNSFEKPIRLKKAGQYVYFSLSNQLHRCKRVKRVLSGQLHRCKLVGSNLYH